MKRYQTKRKQLRSTLIESASGSETESGSLSGMLEEDSRSASRLTCSKNKEGARLVWFGLAWLGLAWSSWIETEVEVESACCLSTVQSLASLAIQSQASKRWKLQELVESWGKGRKERESKGRAVKGEEKTNSTPVQSDWLASSAELREQEQVLVGPFQVRGQSGFIANLYLPSFISSDQKLFFSLLVCSCRASIPFIPTKLSFHCLHFTFNMKECKFQPSSSWRINFWRQFFFFFRSWKGKRSLPEVLCANQFPVFSECFIRSLNQCWSQYDRRWTFMFTSTSISSQVRFQFESIKAEPKWILTKFD